MTYALQLYSPSLHTITRLEMYLGIRRVFARTVVSIAPPESIRAKWPYQDLVCSVIEGPMTLNGYVAVPASHPWYKIHYDECPPKQCGFTHCEHSPEALIKVHGGITFSALEADGWVFGFDTGHYGDY